MLSPTLLPLSLSLSLSLTPALYPPPIPLSAANFVSNVCEASEDEDGAAAHAAAYYGLDTAFPAVRERESGTERERERSREREREREEQRRGREIEAYRWIDRRIGC